MHTRRIIRLAEIIQPSTPVPSSELLRLGMQGLAAYEVRRSGLLYALETAIQSTVLMCTLNAMACTTAHLT